MTREEWRHDLAGLLGIPESDILTRQEAAALRGVHPNKWTNDVVAAPNHYRAPHGYRGVNFYDRRHIDSDPNGVPGGAEPWEAAWNGLTLPWPTSPLLAPVLTPTQIDTRDFLDALTDDTAYKKTVARKNYP